MAKVKVSALAFVLKLGVSTPAEVESDRSMLVTIDSLLVQKITEICRYSDRAITQ